MSGFLDYLDDFDERNRKKVPQKKTKKVVETKQPTKKSKVLCLNVEVSTPNGARLVIEKLQDWIGKQEGVVKKKQFRIPPKKVVKSSSPIKKVKDNPVVESRSHATNILDGLPDAPTENLEPMVMEQSNINNMIPQQTQQVQPNLDSVAGHASALL